MALPYWLIPDYWRLLIQFLHQCHPPHFPLHLIHHPLCHLEGPPLPGGGVPPPPPGVMPPIGC